jgi:hypothetical protein
MLHLGYPKLSTLHAKLNLVEWLPCIRNAPKKVIHEFMYIFSQPNVNFLHNGRKFITTFL